MTQEPLTHRLYRHLRPWLRRVGVLTVARRMVSARSRERLARSIGLGGFDTSTAEGGYIPPALKTQAPAQHLDISGLNIIGDLRADLGIAESARLLARAADLPLAYTEIPYRFGSRSQPVPPNMASGSPYDVSLLHINPSYFLEALGELPADNLAAKYRIAYWYWELPHFPPKWHSLFHYVDEVWVASRYVQENLARAAHKPVVRIPLPIFPQPPTAYTRRDFDLPPNRPVFFFAFNPASSVGRKNPFGVIEAFRRAFGTSPDGPLLLIKTHHLNTPYGEKLRAPLRDALTTVNGRLFTEQIDREALQGLIHQTTCYVSLHRAEGFGLGMAEAMAAGKPVIATGYSGNLDFMTPHNSFLVDYELRPIHAEDHQYQDFVSQVYRVGDVWAEPDVDQAADYMREVVAHPERARRIGERAAQDIARHHSPAQTAQAIRHRLAIIAAHRSQAVHRGAYKRGTSAETLK